MNETSTSKPSPCGRIKTTISQARESATSTSGTLNDGGVALAGYPSAVASDGGGATSSSAACPAASTQQPASEDGAPNIEDAGAQLGSAAPAAAGSSQDAPPTRVPAQRQSSVAEADDRQSARRRRPPSAVVAAAEKNGESRKAHCKATSDRRRGRKDTADITATPGARCTIGIGKGIGVPVGNRPHANSNEAANCSGKAESSSGSGKAAVQKVSVNPKPDASGSAGSSGGGVRTMVEEVRRRRASVTSASGDSTATPQAAAAAAAESRSEAVAAAAAIAIAAVAEASAPIASTQTSTSSPGGLVVADSARRLSRRLHSDEDEIVAIEDVWEDSDEHVEILDGEWTSEDDSISGMHAERSTAHSTGPGATAAWRPAEESEGSEGPSWSSEASISGTVRDPVTLDQTLTMSSSAQDSSSLEAATVNRQSDLTARRQRPSESASDREVRQIWQDTQQTVAERLYVSRQPAEQHLNADSNEPPPLGLQELPGATYRDIWLQRQEADGPEADGPAPSHSLREILEAHRQTSASLAPPHGSADEAPRPRILSHPAQQLRVGVRRVGERSPSPLSPWRHVQREEAQAFMSSPPRGVDPAVWSELPAEAREWALQDSLGEGPRVPIASTSGMRSRATATAADGGNGILHGFPLSGPLGGARPVTAVREDGTRDATGLPLFSVHSVRPRAVASSSASAEQANVVNGRQLTAAQRERLRSLHFLLAGNFDDTFNAPAADEAEEDAEGDDDPADGDDGQGSGTCIVCLDAPAVATFVHGSTGHTACCMKCARGVQRRGSTCPVCRQVFVAVIRNFSN